MLPAYMGSDKPARVYRGAAFWSSHREAVLLGLVGRTDVSHGAFRLWVELAFNWALDDHMCFFIADDVALTFKKTTTTLERWLRELEQHGLVTLERDGRAIRVIFAIESES